jgi:hypothetical protein
MDLPDRAHDELDIIALCDNCRQAHHTALRVDTTESATAVMRLMMRDVYGWWSDNRTDLCPDCTPRSSKAISA